MERTWVVSVLKPGWQEKCWVCVKSQAGFEVKGCTERERLFLTEIRHAYGYTITDTPTGLSLMLLNRN